MLKTIFKIIDGVNKLFVNAAALVLFGMMLMTSLDVVGRYLFNAPLTGVFELTEFMMVCVVFLAMAYTQAGKGHVAVDLVVNRFPEKIRESISVINYLISFLVMALIAWKSVERGFEVMRAGECSGTLGIPVHPFVFIVALGAGGMCLELLKNAVTELMEMVTSRVKS